MAEVTQQLINTGKYETFINRAGEGNSETILFLHGSGPGVFAWANWRYALETAESNMIVWLQTWLGLAKVVIRKHCRKIDKGGWIIG